MGGDHTRRPAWTPRLSYSQGTEEANSVAGILHDDNANVESDVDEDHLAFLIPIGTEEVPEITIATILLHLRISIIIITIIIMSRLWMFR